MDVHGGEGQLIVVAEDDQMLARFLRHALKSEGYSAHIVETGGEAVHLATTLHPAVVVLDVGLPDANGLDICRQIKQDARSADIPILFLTGKNDLDDRINGLEAGAQDYLAKPFAVTEFQARLRAILRSQEEIRQKREHMAQHQEELMAIINHELRAPLTVISMASQILAENRQISAERRDHLIQSIRNSAGSLTHIVDDLVYLTNPSRHLRACQMHALVQAVVEDARPRVHAHGLHLAARLPQDLPSLVVDEAHLRRALHHLIDNAVKFTPRGGIITITVAVLHDGHVVASEPGIEQEIVSATPDALLPTGSQEPWLLIAVRDTGIGIAPEHHRHVFEPFYQVDSSAARTADGLGLGLAVVAAFVRSHHGHLAVRSGNGMGTEIHLALPLHQHAEDTHPAPFDGPTSA
jgi:two-component system sensor histidine kinase/response regulator